MNQVQKLEIVSVCSPALSMYQLFKSLIAQSSLVYTLLISLIWKYSHINPDCPNMQICLFLGKYKINFYYTTEKQKLLNYHTSAYNKNTALYREVCNWIEDKYQAPSSFFCVFDFCIIETRISAEWCKWHFTALDLLWWIILYAIGRGEYYYSN